MNARSHRTAVRITVLVWAFAAVPVPGAAGSPVRIEQPGPDEILYGLTRIVVDTGDLAPDSVLVYVDRFPEAVCRLTEPPYVCEFDAGKGLQGRAIRTVALDGDGRVLGEARCSTLAFPEPVRVVRRTLDVPVVASASGDVAPDLETGELQCLYDHWECEILNAERLRLTERRPLSVSVLIDISGSVWLSRDELLSTVRSILDVFPEHAAVALTEFGQRYHQLGPFTDSRDELEEQIRRIGANETATCLLQAVVGALEALRARRGHRVLFVISDGEDTCDSDITVDAAHRIYTEMRPEALQRVRNASAEINAPLYVYRLKEMGNGGVGSHGDRSYEGLALDTGGRLFTAGDMIGLQAAFEAMTKDLQSTWMVEILLPAEATGVEPRRLSLDPAGSLDAALRYPEYWSPAATEEALIARLRAGAGLTRYDAARELFDHIDPDVLRALTRAVMREPDDRIRAVELDGIVNLGAHLLLHGDEGEQKDALDAIDAVSPLDPERLARLRPALTVYQKMDPPKRLRRRAAAHVAAGSGNGLEGDRPE